MAIRRPTKAQRLALLTALSDEHTLALWYPELGCGFRPKTLKVLVDAGWLRHKAGVDWDEARLTVAGRLALGLPKRLPRTFRAALLSGIEALMQVGLSKDAMMIGDNIPTMCLDEDTNFWLETERVRASFDLHDLNFPPSISLDYDDSVVALGAVSGWMRERGFPVEMEIIQGHVLIFDGDEEE